MQELLDKPAPAAPTYASNDPVNNIDPTGEVANGAFAAIYALRYAYDYNSAYPVLGNDCTNFMSQALNAGGMKQKNTGDALSGWWFKSGTKDEHLTNSPPFHSMSWYEVSTLKNWLLNLSSPKRGKIVKRRGTMSVGDIIFIDLDGYGSSGAGAADHAMMVTGHYTKKVGKKRVKEVRLSAHTNDRHNVPWDDVYDKDDKYTYVHIKSWG